MGLVLTSKGKAQCPHGGMGMLASLQGSPLVTVEGLPVLTEQSVGPVGFSCPSVSPCVTVTSWIVEHFRCTVGGVRILTDKSIPVTNNGPGKIIDPGQMKCELKP